MAGLPTNRAVWGVLFPAFAAGVLQTCSAALAQGATDYPIPSTAREAYSPIGEGFDSPLDPRDDLRGARRYVDPREERLKARRAQRSPNAPVFFRDTDLRANSRTYWFEEDAFGLTEPKAFTTGGSVTYASGYLADFFQLRGALYTTQPLYANATAGAAETLTLDGDQITVLGQLNGRVKFAGQEVTAGRFLVRTPFINPFDVRMIPLTFEGVALMPESADPKVHYMVSYLSHYKRRDESLSRKRLERRWFQLLDQRHAEHGLWRNRLSVPIWWQRRLKSSRRRQHSRSTNGRCRFHPRRALRHVSGIGPVRDELSRFCLHWRGVASRK
jgi:hypothetical protein